MALKHKVYKEIPSSLQSSRPMPRVSLAQQVADLADPTPRSVDPESLSAFGDGTGASMGAVDRTSYGDGDGEASVAGGRLTLRAEPDALNDPRYAGIAVSRSALKGTGASDSSSSGIENSKGDGRGSGSDASDDGGSSDDDSDDSQDLSNHDVKGDDNSEDSDDDNNDLDRQLELVSRRGSASSAAVPHVPAQLRAKEKERATHTLNQKKLWGELLEIRMRLQPLLELGNRLPEASGHALFHDHSDESVEAFESAVDALSGLVRTCVGMRTALSERHPDVRALPAKRKRKRSEDSVNDLWDEIDTGHENFAPYRDAVIARWNSKTQLQSGAALHKKFKIVNQGILAQIDSVMADEARLLKRTRVRRMEGVPIGHELAARPQSNDCDDDNDGGNRKSGMHPGRHDSEADADDIDPEIFDDTDFFKQHRQEYLENTMSGDDLLSISKAFALRSRRTKKRKNIDTKATKGRRLHYVVMPKLQNFMAPEHFPPPSINIDVLIGSLFGGKARRRNSN